MNQSSHLLKLVIFLVSLSPYLASSEDESIKQEIKMENKKWADAYAQGNYIKVGELYTETGELLPPGEVRVIGKDAIVEYFKAKSSIGGPRSVKFSNYEFYGDNRVLTEISDVEIRDNKGNLLSEGKQILIFLKQKGEWKLHRDIWNSNNK